MYPIYFLVALFSSVIGSITGMGGGVIIKPVFDTFGIFDAQSIGVLSSFTVLSMALVSALRNLARKTAIPVKTAVLVAIGSIVGGYIGQSLLNLATNDMPNNRVIVTQNILLAIIIFIVFIYMKIKTSLPSFQTRNSVLVLVVGLFLGVVSSFLGIGGGPINVAAFIFFFSYDTKTAAISSLVTIVFAQTSKLLSVGYDVGFADFDLSPLPFMVAGAVLGALIGSKISEKLSNQLVDTCFNAVQLLVLGLCVVNIVRYQSG